MLSDEKIEELRSTLHIAISASDFRAIEAAVLAELAKQEPVAYEWDTPVINGTWRGNLGYEPPKHPVGYARLRALYAAPVVQPDMVMVPREPTEAMYAAVDNERLAQAYWRKLIAAAEKEQK